MKFLDFDSFQIEGELYKRLMLSKNRMMSDHYNPDLFLTQAFVSGADWPGDTEGRLLLALSMLFQALNEKADYVRTYFEKILSFMNEDGYLGAKIDENAINEQSLSGNSWLMRGMCEYYEWTKDGAHFQRLKRWPGDCSSKPLENTGIIRWKAICAFRIPARNPDRSPAKA